MSESLRCPPRPVRRAADVQRASLSAQVIIYDSRRRASQYDGCNANCVGCTTPTAFYRRTIGYPAECKNFLIRGFLRKALIIPDFGYGSRVQKNLLRSHTSRRGPFVMQKKKSAFRIKHTSRRSVDHIPRVSRAPPGGRLCPQLLKYLHFLIRPPPFRIHVGGEPMVTVALDIVRVRT
ncbi:hypothetical protein EVAR_42452_1 [Eumeta japonica]|uniref:Uncharacterized protein n=1 Tax=Eumeta variegata TaxID=151549 RepID=A0A4C1XX17_EUMVA|nr:hypothetical protein EVAR_42452_1 [Eumeta japonica]